MRASLQPGEDARATTELVLPRLGFGAAPLGNLYHSVSDQQAQDTLQAAVKSGMTYFDTAPHYGFGLSESRLGELLSTQPEIKLSTKVGRLLVPTHSSEKQRHGFVDTPPLEPTFDYSYSGIMRSFESSQQRLKREKIDLLLVHDLGELTHGAEHAKHWRDFLQGGLSAMQELKQAGLISAMGIGVNEWQVAQNLIHQTDIDYVLLAGRYTLLEQQAAQEFFPNCEKKNVKIILGGIFNSGILATGVQSDKPAFYNYATAPENIIEKVKKLESICKDYSVSLPAVAVQFVAKNSQVSSLIFGLASEQEVKQLMAWMNEKIPNDLWQAFQAQGLIDSDIKI